MMSDTASETAERALERARARKAGEQANAEMMTRFAPLTGDNVGEALEWQAARLRELLRGV